LTTGKRSNIIATRLVSWAHDYQNCSRSSAPDTDGGALPHTCTFRGREGETEGKRGRDMEDREEGNGKGGVAPSPQK